MKTGAWLSASGIAIAALVAAPAAAQDRMVGAWALTRYGEMCSLKTSVGDGGRGAVVGLVQRPETSLNLHLSFPADETKFNTGTYALTIDGARVGDARLTPPGFGSAFKPPLAVGKEMKAWIDIPAAQSSLLRTARALTVVRTDGAKPVPVVRLAAPPMAEGLDGLAACLAEAPPPAYVPPPPPPEPKVPVVPFSEPLSIGIWRIDPTDGCHIRTRMKAYPYDASKQVLGSLGFPDVNITVRKFGDTRYQISVGDVPKPRAKVSARTKAEEWSFRLGSTVVKAPLVPTGYIEVGPVGTFDDLPALLGGKPELLVRYRVDGIDEDHVGINLTHLDLALRAQAMCRTR